jgi:hypothetical protein
MKLSLLGVEQAPVQLVPAPVQTKKVASVFGSVISIGALRSALLIMIFEVSAFANNTVGIASKRRRTKTESSRFTVHPHILPFPGRTEEWYRLNVSTIFHGVEGKWFRAWSVWEGVARPLIAGANAEAHVK